MVPFFKFRIRLTATVKMKLMLYDQFYAHTPELDRNIDALFTFGRRRSNMGACRWRSLTSGKWRLVINRRHNQSRFYHSFWTYSCCASSVPEHHWTGKTSSSRESTTCFFDNPRSSSLQASHCRHNTKRGWKVILPFQALFYFIYFVLDKCWRIYLNSHMQLSYIQPASRPIRGTI